MDIREEKVYIFRFPYQQTDFTIPVRAETKQEAADILQKWLSGVQTDLAIEFPKVLKQEPMSLREAASPLVSVVPPEVLELRIDTLLGDMGGSQLNGKAKNDTIKLWTGLENTEANYPQIIRELELLKTGQKEVPAKKNDKKT